MAHISKRDLTELARTNPLAAYALVLANHAQYTRDGFIGDAPPAAGAPATPAGTAAPAVSNPPASLPSFRERCAEAERASPGSGRALLLTNPGLYISGEPAPAPFAEPVAPK
jgi:hypothetical protein